MSTSSGPKKDLSKIVKTQHAAEFTKKRLRKQSTATSYRSFSVASDEGKPGSQGADGEKAPLEPLEDEDDDVFAEDGEEDDGEDAKSTKSKTKSVADELRASSGGKYVFAK